VVVPVASHGLFGSFSLLGSHLNNANVTNRLTKKSATPGSHPKTDAKGLAAPLLPQSTRSIHARQGLAPDVDEKRKVKTAPRS